MSEETEKTRNLELIERLTDELMKRNPEENLIKEYMMDIGIPFTSDPIKRINLVLEQLNFHENHKDFE